MYNFSNTNNQYINNQYEAQDSFVFPLSQSQKVQENEMMLFDRQNTDNHVSAKNGTTHQDCFTGFTYDFKWLKNDYSFPPLDIIDNQYELQWSCAPFAENACATASSFPDNLDSQFSMSSNQVQAQTAPAQNNQDFNTEENKHKNGDTTVRITVEKTKKSTEKKSK